MTFINVDASALTHLSMKFVEIIAALPVQLQAALEEAGTYTTERLAEAAPRGQNEGNSPPIGDDAPGPLAESFEVQMASSGSLVTATVTTTQLNKLKIIVEGRKEVRPVVKRALFWQGLEHPVMRSKATEPNDFVSPVVQDGIDYAHDAITAAVSDVLALLNE